MPKVAKQTDFLQRLALVEEQLAALRRSGRPLDELPFFPTSFHGMVYEDNTAFTTYWETVFTPRTASLSLGLIFIGDQAGSPMVNTGGEWQVLFDSTVVMSGTVAATFSYQYAAQVLDLTPYRSASELKVTLQARRTSGSTTGGRYGLGGAIGLAPRYARLL